MGNTTTDLRSFKTAFGIMGLSVEVQDLSMVCPDVGNIANWEFRFAAGTKTHLTLRWKGLPYSSVDAQSTTFCQTLDDGVLSALQQK